jgi:hypothetical protein
VNSTSDGSPIGPVVDGQQNRTLTQSGGIFTRTFSETAWDYNGPAQIDFEIYACRNVVPVLPNLTQGLPEWAMDESRFGSTAITTSFLASNPSETDVRNRVDAIKRSIDQRDELGKKESKRELDEWFKAVRKLNPRQSDQLCGDAQIIHGTLDVSQYWGRRVALITVTGDRTKGYVATIQ